MSLQSVTRVFFLIFLSLLWDGLLSFLLNVSWDIDLLCNAEVISSWMLQCSLPVACLAVLVYRSQSDSL